MKKKGSPRLVFVALHAFGVLVLLAHPAPVRRPWVSVTAAPVTLAATTDVRARNGPLAARFVELERPGLGGLLLGGLPLLRQLGLDLKPSSINNAGAPSSP